jgi:hypothetical protein
MQNFEYCCARLTIELTDRGRTIQDLYDSRAASTMVRWRNSCEPGIAPMRLHLIIAPGCATKPGDPVQVRAH